MPTIERSIHVSAPPDRVFAYLSEVEHLPEYFPDITEAEPERGDLVHVEARIPDGSTRAGEAHFDVDEAARRIEWSGERKDDYHGWLEVHEERDGSRVDLGLTMQHEDVDDSIGRTLETIRRKVEGGP